jgi:chromosome segregation ATPase
MAAAAVALLNDPDRLATLAESGCRTARQQGDWEAYKRRLLEVVAEPDAMVAAGTYARSQVRRRVADEQERLLGRLGALECERDALQGERDALQRERDALRHERDALQHERDSLERERDRHAAEAASLRERTVALWLQLDEASQRVQELNEGLLGTLSSSSWKVTKPLRASMGVVRALVRIARAWVTVPHRTKS